MHAWQTEYGGITIYYLLKKPKLFKMYHVEYFVTYQYLNLNISKCIVESTLTYGILLCVQALGHSFFKFAFYPLSLSRERERVLQQICT